MNSTTIAALYLEAVGKGCRMFRRPRGDRRLAWRTARSVHGPWRPSGSPVLRYALPNRYVRNIGVPKFAKKQDEYKLIGSTMLPGLYGSWCGMQRCREALHYPEGLQAQECSLIACFSNFQLEMMKLKETESLSRLICGHGFSSKIEIDKILKHLSISIKKIINEIAELPAQEDDKLPLYGPYLGRALLELSATALLARVDPFKVLLVKGKQENTDYELGKPHSSAIRWQGDVVDKAVSNLWDDKALGNPTRAILGAYQVELVMIDSAERIIGNCNEDSIGSWYNNLTQTDAKGLIERIKVKVNSLYSSLSKGVHHELLVPIESILDRNTVLTLINDTIYIVSTLSLLVSQVPHAYQSSPLESSLQLYKSCKELEVV